MLTFNLLAIFALAIGAAAQSDPCITAFITDLPYGIHECLDDADQNLYFTGNSTTNTSEIVSKAICPSPKCPPANLTLVSEYIHNACATDLALAGSVNETFANFFLSEIDQYTESRNANCLQAKSNGSYCVTEFFHAVDVALGYSYNSTTLESDFDAGINASNAALFCTDCVKAFAFATAKVYTYNISSMFTSNLQSLTMAKCGANFLDGGIPSTVIQSASNATLDATAPPRNASGSGTSSSAGPSSTASGAASGASSAAVTTGSAAASGSAAPSASATAKSAGSKVGEYRKELVVVALLGIGALTLFF